MRRNIRLILTLVRMKLSQQMVFRFSFFGAFFVDGSLFLLQILMFSAIYAQVDTIGGWTRGQMLIFIGTFSLINALNMAIFFFGVNDIPRKIREGSLDHYITKPVSPLLRLTFENVNPGSLPLVALSVAIIAYGVRVQGVRVDVGLALEYTAMVGLMTLLWYDMEILLRTLPFFTLSIDGADRLEGTALEMCMKVPGVIFQGVWKALFCLFVPYGIMATVPTQLITRTLSPLGAIYAAGICTVFTAFAFWFWRFGLRHYKSASS